jgi:hypothetical protein
MQPLQVVTFLWSDPKYRFNHVYRYAADHVRKLFRGVSRHLKTPHETVLITDNPQAIDAMHCAADRVIPLWQDFRKYGGCYTRLKAFAPSMRELIGPRFVWLDLDAVITGSLDELFNRPEPFIAWRDVHPPTPYCGSMMMMNAGARAKVWERAQREIPGRVKQPGQWCCRPYIGTDQAFIGHVLGPREATWTAADGVYNWHAEILPKHRGALPDNARIVFFTGPRDPSMASVQRISPWVREHWT